MRNMTIPSFFASSLDLNRGNRLFNFKMIDGNWKSVTYDEFHKIALAITSYLQECGVSRGDKVAIYSENRVQWCATYMAVIFAGAVTVPIDAQLTSGDVAVILEDSGAKMVFASNQTMPQLKTALETDYLKGNPPFVINFDSGEFNSIRNTTGDLSNCEVDEQDIASLVYTSGTTGRPKAVMLTHYNLCSDAEAVINAKVIEQGDNVLSMLPLHHTYALMGTFIVPIFVGAEITYPPTIKGPELISAIREKEVTIIVAVPRILDSIKLRLAERLSSLPPALKWLMFGMLSTCGYIRKKLGMNMGKLVFSSVHKSFGRRLKYITSGGARLEPSTMGFMESIGFTVLEGYGLTETSPVVAFNPPSLRKAGSVGKPFETVEIKIINPDEKGEGEVAIKGPMVMKGYYKNQTATTAVLKDGWFYSGDLGFVDKDGYLFLTGRLKDVIVLGSGKNIYPEELEKIYSKIPLVKEICVFALRDRLQAVIVPDSEYAKKTGIGYINEALRWDINKVSHSLPPYMRLMGFTLEPNPLPRTPLGKLRRFMIKDLIETKAYIAKEDKSLASDKVGRIVIEALKPLVEEGRNIQAMDNLELDLGLDSLNRIELVVALEKLLSIKLPEDLPSQVQTVSELVALLKEFKEHGTGGLERKGDGIRAVLYSEPSDDDKKRVGFGASLFERAVVYSTWLLIKTAFKAYFRLEVKGLENIPPPPYIIAPNHASYIDGLAVGFGVNYGKIKGLYFQGFRKYFVGAVTSIVARLLHVIPIEPDTHLNHALAVSSYVLRNKGALCIFPEGGRSFDGKLLEFKKGIGMLAVGLNVPVVPAYIDGSFKAFSRHMKFPRPHKVSVRFGKPIYPSETDYSKRTAEEDEYQYFSNIIKEKVEELKNIYTVVP